MSLADLLVLYGAIAAIASLYGLIGLISHVWGEDYLADGPDADDTRWFARVVILSPLWLLVAIWGLAKAVRWLFHTAFPKESK